MRKLMWLFLITCWSGTGYGQNITQVEYFLDTDPGYGSGTAVSGFAAGTQLADVNFSVPVASLAKGVHRLYIRAKDSGDKWSFVSSHLFFKEILAASLSNVDLVEYFIDTDPGYGAGTSVPFAASTSVNELNFPVPVAALSVGVHRLFIRARQASGQWSEISQHLFYRQQVPALTNITRIEYFIDTDPGFGVATNVPFTAGLSISDLTFSAPADNLDPGTHYLLVRARDANGAWSIIGYNDFTVPLPPLPVRLQYFTGRRQEKTSKLEWATAEESGSDHFEIQRSSNAKKWTVIDTVNASGESNAGINYVFTDSTPLPGQNFYRLRMVDRDKSFSMSGIVLIQFETELQTVLYPNPASRQVMVSAVKEMIAYQLLDAGGRTALFRTDLPGSGQLRIPLDKIQAGHYTLKITFRNGQAETRKLVVE